VRALVATGASDAPLEIRTVDEPTAEASQSIVEVRAISINRGELRLKVGGRARTSPGSSAMRPRTARGRR
jgi:NADPH:quinone reductase-like Zn-dependent oxidoreductase